MRLWTSVAALFSIIHLALAGYIRTDDYSSGYIRSEDYSAGYTRANDYTSGYTRSDDYSSGYVPSDYSAGYLPAPSTSTARYPTGYLREPPSRRPVRSTTPRLRYDSIFSDGGARQPTSERSPAQRTRPHPSYPAAATKSDRAGVALDRSDTYHTGNGDVCGDFQTIGLGAGAASLLAFLVYILLTNSLTSTVAATNRRAAGADPWLARTAVTATCAAADLLNSSSETARRRETENGHQDGNGDESADGKFPWSSTNGENNHEFTQTSNGKPLKTIGINDDGEPSLRLVSSNEIPDIAPPSAPWARRVRSGVHRFSSRQFGDDCFSEMIGALAGLAGLGALSGFSLSQSAQALLTSMMTIAAMTTTTTTTTTTGTGTSTTGSGTGGGRLLDDSSDQPTGLALVGRIAALALTPGDLPCVQRDLCQLVREGHRAGRPHDTTLPLARGHPRRALQMSCQLRAVSPRAAADAAGTSCQSSMAVYSVIGVMLVVWTALAGRSAAQQQQPAALPSATADEVYGYIARAVQQELQPVVSKLESRVESLDKVVSRLGGLPVNSPSGVYLLRPSGNNTQPPVEAYCDMDTAGGNWTVIQRRDDIKPHQYFYLGWTDYKEGFENSAVTYTFP
ncbi:Techylectin-5B [Amphibalanus amphitrite]|uniref:Techylectin-5B n=1 Tax=Amphibalanus amphitrite TaxID=1232801 RepID=A0A6A4VLH7_AMPAM|nr:Techylectin-5B [Amphibalanus amphitrite]